MSRSTFAAIVSAVSLTCVVLLARSPANRPAFSSAVFHVAHGDIDGRNEGKPLELVVPYEPPRSILFFGEVETRKDDGTYEESDLFYQKAQAKPGEPKELDDCRVKGHPVMIAVTSVRRDSAEMRLGYRNETRAVTITRKATDVLFDNDSVKVSIQLGATSLAPFAADDEVLKSPLTAYKIDNGISPVPIRKHKVLATRKMTREQAVRLQKALTDSRNFALDGATCFEPGMDFVYGDGENAIHIVVCLACYKIHIATEDETQVSYYYGLTKPGVAEFTALYNEIF